MVDGFLGLALGASALGLTHGLAPGHGWAIAASYALDKPNKWLYGAASSLVLGLGHLVSSVAMVVVYFWAISYFGLTQLDWMNYVAGALLIALGIWQYVNGHAHVGGGHDHSHGHGHHHADDYDHDHGHSHDHEGHEHSHADDHDHDYRHGHAENHDHTKRHGHDHGRSHDHHHADDAADRSLYGMVALAFALGFTHNEEFDIIAICTGSTHCLELMLLYSVAVIVSLVGVTLALVAGYERYEDRLEGYVDHLPAFTATVLVGMGVGFVLGVF